MKYINKKVKTCIQVIMQKMYKITNRIRHKIMKDDKILVLSQCINFSDVFLITNFFIIF